MQEQKRSPFFFVESGGEKSEGIEIFFNDVYIIQEWFGMCGLEKQPDGRVAVLPLVGVLQ